MLTVSDFVKWDSRVLSSNGCFKDEFTQLVPRTNKIGQPFDQRLNNVLAEVMLYPSHIFLVDPYSQYSHQSREWFSPRSEHEISTPMSHVGRSQPLEIQSKAFRILVA
jgi:hypothetical protein